MQELIIRKGVKADLPGVLALIHELAEFEKAKDAVTNTLAAMEEDGFGEKPVYGFHVAEAGKKIIGVALYFVKYSTWVGKGLYLDDLVITEAWRSKGIGRKLFNEFIREAQLSGAKQVHWQVLDWNTPAIEFYEKLGASVDAAWLDCKLTEDQIRNFNFSQ